MQDFEVIKFHNYYSDQNHHGKLIIKLMNLKVYNTQVQLLILIYHIMYVDTGI